MRFNPRAEYVPGSMLNVADTLSGQIYSQDGEFHMNVSYQPHSNGAAEKMVHIAKTILRQEDQFLALMTYRATPIAATGFSPSQLMMGRTIHTTLPILKQNLAVQWPDITKVKENDDKAKSTYKYYYNRRYSTRPIANIPVGARVRIRTSRLADWSQTTSVVSPVGNPSLRSYNIRDDHGQVRCRSCPIN